MLNFKSLGKKILFFLVVMGPGFAVMLADADVGSIVVAAQSGAVWGYKLLLLQLILIPILYIAQELTVRLGLVTGKGHGALIKKHFGNFWAWLSVGTLVVCCMGAIVTEISGIASVGLLFGMPIWLSTLLVTVFLIWLVWTRSYNSVERIALAIGSFALIYIVVAWQVSPNWHELRAGLVSLPLHNHEYLYMVAANIGAVIMPWMIFYQQSAVVDKKLTIKHLKMARLETFLGAIVAQAIMIAVLIVAAATIGKIHGNASLDAVQQISEMITPYLGVTLGKILFGLGMIGAALIATVVVSLAAAWGVGEITGCKHSLQDCPHEAPWFYGAYLFTLIVGGLIVISGIPLVSLNVAIEVMNALLLPIVLLFLFLLACKALPEEYKLKGTYAWVVGIILFITSAVGLFGGLWGILA
ncbi:MAG: divalent metal cation transporter [Gammaproteobacteria bacterium]